MVSQERRIKLYNSIVKSTLLYNSGTWGLTKHDEKKLNTFHRKQLKQVSGIKWPHRIRSITLYETTKTVPITYEITKRRWKLFGHVLRMPAESPARKSMKFFFEKTPLVKYSGRKRASIITTLNRDIRRTKALQPRFDISEIKSEIDLHNVRVKATNRRLWKKRIEQVVSAAYSDMS